MKKKVIYTLTIAVVVILVSCGRSREEDKELWEQLDEMLTEIDYSQTLEQLENIGEGKGICYDRKLVNEDERMIIFTMYTHALEKRKKELGYGNNIAVEQPSTNVQVRNVDIANGDNVLNGKYEFVDVGNRFYVQLTVNADNTATMHYKESDIVRYGAWRYYKVNGHTEFVFEDGLDFRFNIGESRKLNRFYVYEGWVYPTFDAVRAKNPDKRVPIKKID